MTGLAKITIRTMFQHFGAFRSTTLILSLVLIALYCGYRFGNYYHNYQHDLIKKQQERLDKLYQHQEVLSAQVNTLTVELEVERMANQRSVNLLKEMEVEHYQVKRQLAFYEKIMAPEKHADGVAFDSLLVFPTQSPRHYRFELTLVQQQLKKRYAKGYVDINLIGSMNNEPHTAPINKVSSLTKKLLSFSFKYFQVIEGEFTLPEGFTVEKVALIATLPKGRWQKYQQTQAAYPWRTIIKQVN